MGIQGAPFLKLCQKCVWWLVKETQLYQLKGRQCHAVLPYADGTTRSWQLVQHCVAPSAQNRAARLRRPLSHKLTSHQTLWGLNCYIIQERIHLSY